MGKSRRNERREQAERPMPERPRLEPVPDFIPFAERIAFPSHEQPRREPHHGRLPASHVYVAVMFNAHLDCDHHWHRIDTFGVGVCTRCSVEGWSPDWVAAGLYGLKAALGEGEDGTAAFIADREAQWAQAVEQS